MKTESAIFLVPAAFFIASGVAYGLVSDWEIVGTLCILISGLLAVMIGVYFAVLARRHGARPEDRLDADMGDFSGDQGIYAPWSWWPIVLAGGAALAFLSLAVGWWMMVPAAMVGIVGLVGWVFEFSRGQHAH